MKILEALSLFDRFKRPIFLFSRNSQKQSTKMGVLVSLSIYMFLLYFFLNSDMIRRQNPKIMDQAVENSARPEIQLKDVVFAVDNDESVSFVDKTIFYVQGSIRYLKVNTETHNGYEYEYNLEEELRICTKEDFDTEVFDQKGFQNKFCFNNKSLPIKGFWDEKEIKYVTVNLKRCMNSTLNNYTCRSDEEIDDFFKDKYFTIYFTNPFVDLSDDKNPLKSIWRTDYQNIDTNSSKISRLYFKKVEFLDDTNLPFVSNHNQETFNYEKRENDFLFRERSEVLFDISLYASNIIQKNLEFIKEFQMFLQI